MDISSIKSPLLEELNLTQMPQHIAIIMDGNGRWAKKNSLPRIQGHWEGVKTVDRTVSLCRKRMKNENIRFHTIGQLEELPLGIQKLIANTKDYTKNCNGMTLTLALSYGGRQEILKSVQQIARKVHFGELSLEEIDCSLFEKFLKINSVPDPDLLIRTSGEMRISNFLLYQIAYTELHFTKVLWPEFKEEDLLHAIIDFQKRERRFGMTQDQVIKS